MQAVHPAGAGHRRDADADHLYHRTARGQHGARPSRVDARAARRAHDLSVRAVVLDTHQRVLRDGMRDHRREHGARLTSDFAMITFITSLAPAWMRATKFPSFLWTKPRQ